MTTDQVANVQKWIKALRSGKYEQGRGRLCRDDRYCCLGVACDVMKVPFKKVDDNSYLSREYIFDGESQFGVASNEWFHDKFGLEIPSQGTLTNMNDFGHYDFNAIADYIENYINETVDRLEKSL